MLVINLCNNFLYYITFEIGINSKSTKNGYFFMVVDVILL